MSPVTAQASQAIETASVASSPFVQRKCSCGSGAGVSGQCAGCDAERRFGEHSLQPKLRVSTPGDRYEQEADRLADAATAMPGERVAAARPEGSLTPAAGTATPIFRQVTPFLQRQEGPTEVPEEEPEEEPIQMKRADSSPQRSVHAGPPFSARLDSERQGGDVIDFATRSSLGPRFGVDFSRVRVHSNRQAAELAAKLHARAFTVGHHIFFGTGQYEPSSARGRHLLSHELVHTLQQEPAQPALGSESSSADTRDVAAPGRAKP